MQANDNQKSNCMNILNKYKLTLCYYQRLKILMRPEGTKETRRD